MTTTSPSVNGVYSGVANGTQQGQAFRAVFGMQLTQQGQAVSGTVTGDVQGSVSGTLNGTNFTFTLNQVKPYAATLDGTGTVSPDGNTIVGSYHDRDGTKQINATFTASHP